MKHFYKIICFFIASLFICQLTNAQTVVFDIHTSATNNTICRNEPFTLYMTPLQNIRYVFQYSENNGPWTDYTNLSSDVSAGTEVSQSITLIANTQFRVYYTTNTSIGAVPNTIDPTVISVTVNQLPSITSIIAPTNTICQNTTTTFSDATLGGVWSVTNATIAGVNSSTGVVSGLSSGTTLVKYQVTDPLTGCKNQVVQSITINPTPIISSFSDAVCSGSQYAVIPIGSVPAGTTFVWAIPTTNAINPTDLTGMASSGTSTQTTVNALLTNNTSAVIAATYSITATKGTCSSVPFNLTLSVTPKPIILDRVYQACSGAGFTDPVSNVNGNIVPAGITYYWSSPTVPTGISNQAASGTPTPTVFGANLTNSTTGTLSVTYTVATFNSGCPGTTFTETVNVNPTPIITTKATAICSNALFSIPITNGVTEIVPTNTTYTWQAPNVNGITGTQAGTSTSTVSGTLVNNTAATISNIQYLVTPTSGDAQIGYCSGSTFIVNVTVYPLPIIANVGPTQTSSSVTFNYNIGQAGDLIPVGTTYFWGVPAAPVGLTGGAASATQTQTSLNGTLVNPTGSYLDAIYTITPSFNNCPGSTFTFDVRVYPRPIIGPKSATICSGQIFGPIFLTDGVNGDVIPGGTTYSWPAPIVTNITGTVSATAVGTISGTLNNTSNFPITVVYVVTPYANPQAGDPFNVTVVVNPLPIASISITENSGLAANDKIICNDVNANFAAVPVVGAITDYNYTWTVPIGATPPGNAASFNSNIAGTYGLDLTNINTGCASAVQTTTSLTVNPIPTVGQIVGANNVCVNSSITLSTSNVSGGSGTYSYYYWYDNNSLVAPFTSPSVNVRGVNAGDGLLTYKVQDNLGCNSAMSPVFTLHVNALPLAPTAVSINQVYDGLLHTGSAIAANPAAEQIDWYLNNIGASTSVAPSATNVGPTITRYATAKNSTTGCVSASRTAVTVNISQKTLTITANDFVKTYDRIVYTGGNGVIYTGFVNGENESVLSGTLSYGGTAQNKINVGTYTIIPGGLSAGNYAITTVPGNLIINAKGLTITGAAVQNKVYDATDIATMNAGSLLGVISADIPNVTLNRIAKFSSKNVGANLVITSYSTISGSAATNYTLDPTINVLASITPKHIDAIGIVTIDKVYDGTTNATVTGGAFNTAIVAGSGNSNDKSPYIGDQIQLLSSGYFTSKDVGNNIAITSTSTISGADMNNYILDAPILMARNISPKALQMTGLSVPNPKVYDATNLAVVVGAPLLPGSELPGTGTVLDGKPYSNDVVTITGNVVGTYNSKDVATASNVSFSGLSLAGANANDYTLIFQPFVYARIQPKMLTMFGLNVAVSKQYDGTTNAIVNGSAQLQSAEAAFSGNVLDGKPYLYDDVSIAGSPIGTYNSKDVTTAASVHFTGLTLTGSQASNYDFTMQADASSVIYPLIINVLANVQSKIYGDVDPQFTFTNDALIGEDQFSGALGRVVGENIGTYQINIGSLTLGDNYTIQYTPNNLSILAAYLTIKAKPIVRTYGDLPLPVVFTTSNLTAVGLKNNESVGTVTINLPSGIGSGNSIKDPVGIYGGVVATTNPQPGTVDLSNYRIVLLPTDLIVNKYPITISADPKSKRKSQEDPALTYTVSAPLVSGDVLTGALVRTPGDEVGFYPILQGTVQINDNYDITYVPANLEILTIERVMVVPNAFTPNNDGLNDLLKVIRNSTIVSINYFKVFNRAGVQLFETRDINEGWDGRSNGVAVDADAYYWIVEYNTWDNKTFKVKGSSLLIK